MSRGITAVLWGVIIYLGFSLAVVEFNDVFFHSLRDEARGGEWYYALADLPQYLGMVLPPFIAGNIAGKHGFVVGFSVSVIGYIIFIVILTLIQYEGVSVFITENTLFLSKMLLPSIQYGIVGCFAGAAGELVANNKASKKADGGAAA